MNAQDQEKTLSALYHLSPDMPECDWWRVGAALRSESEALFDAFDQWSSGGRSYKGTKDCRATWNAHPPKSGGINIGTLYGMAMAHGWKQSKTTNASHVTRPKPPTKPPETPAPTEAPKPTSPVYDLQNAWERATPATLEHAYCIVKGVTDPAMVEGLRVLPSTDRLRIKGHSMANALLVPSHTHDGTLCTVQCIAHTGTKADGSPKFDKVNFPKCHHATEDGAQGFHAVGAIEAGQPVHIVEGVGTAWAIYQATGKAAAISFGVGRTEKVARAIQQHHPEALPVLVPDIGQETTVGKVAKVLGCAVVTFPTELGDNADAWDYVQVHGPQALTDLLAQATQPSKPVPSNAGNDGDGQIPGMDARPAYRVFDKWVEEGGQKFKPGVWLFGTKTEGRGDNAVVAPTETWICTPLHIDAGTSDAHDGSYGRLLRFENTRGNLRQWAMPMHMLAGDGTALCENLYSMGMLINSKPGLVRYLQSKVPPKDSYLLCVHQPGWADTQCRAFVLPDTVIGPDAAKVVYQSDTVGDADFGTAGTLEGWQAGIAAMAVGNPMLALAICTALAGPLLSKCNAESGGPHFIGPSSTGKSSAMAAAISAWGSPTYKRGWLATSNGIEATAAQFNDCLLALDEISECDPANVGKIVYMLGNGQGKARADRAGGFRKVARWRVSVLSNGERSIGTSMAEGGYRIKAGQEVRIFDVPCANRAYDVWDTLHHYPDARAFSDGIKAQAKAHYGHAGRAFVERLAKEEADLGEWLASIRTLPELSSKGEGQEQRVAGRFALLALAGELASFYGVTGWPKGEAIRAAAAGLEAWRSLQADKDGANRERGQIVQAVTDFIDKHTDGRFSDADADHDAFQRQPIIHNRAGFWRNTDTGRVYLFNSNGLREALQGYDFGRALVSLREAGLMLPPGKDGKPYMQRKVQGRNGHWYVVHPDGVGGTV